MKIIAVIQSRMGSSRLPGKSLTSLAGRPMVQHVIERARAIQGLADVVLVTSSNERDRPLVELAKSLNFSVICGSEHDVLDRYLTVAQVYQPDAIMRLTGDTPLLCADVCGQVLEAFQTRPVDVDYVINDTTRSGWPDGLDCECASVSAIFQAARYATSATDREHVTPWIRRHLTEQTVMADENWTHLKLSVDSREDLALVRQVYGHLPAGDFTWPTTLKAVKATWH